MWGKMNRRNNLKFWQDHYSDSKNWEVHNIAMHKISKISKFRDETFF